MELTLTSEKMKEQGAMAGGNTVNTNANEKAQRNLINKILASCEECSYKQKTDKFGLPFGRITYPDGHYFDVTLDPWVVEVTGKPIPQSKVKEITERIQRDIYENARTLGYQPGFGAGGGHIHFGVKGLFNQDASLFRDFMVDLHNHSELGSGILNYDHANSPPINVLPEKSQRAFWNIINEFDENPTSLKDLARAIYKRVHKRTVKNWDPPEKYHGVNLMRVAKKNVPYKEQTVELRFVRPQQSGEQFRLITELMTKRIYFLKERRRLGVIPELSNNHPQTMEEKFNRFVQFIEDTGEPAEKYFRILPGDYGELSWRYILNKYPGDNGKLWVFLQEFAEDVAYDEDIKANFILSKLESLDEIQPQHEKTMGTLLERSNESPFFNRIKSVLTDNRLWSNSQAAYIFRDYLERGKSFHKNCRQMMLEILVPVPRAN
jgi:hypothetical protein